MQNVSLISICEYTEINGNRNENGKDNNQKAMNIMTRVKASNKKTAIAILKKTETIKTVSIMVMIITAAIKETIMEMIMGSTKAEKIKEEERSDNLYNDSIIKKNQE